MPTPAVHAPESATPLVAHQVARYFAMATGRRWPTIREDIVGYLTPFLDGMNGDAASKVTRACGVIDAAVLETPRPTLRYVFHAQMYWKRLDALSNPRAKPLARRATRPADAAPTLGETFKRPSTVAASSTTPCDTRETPKPVLRATPAANPNAAPTDVPWSPRDLGPPSRAEPRPVTAEEQAELEELYRLDTAARARRGLPPLYPSGRAA